MAISRLPLTADLADSYQRRTARMQPARLGRPGDPFNWGVTEERPPSFGGMDFSQGTIQRGQTSLEDPAKYYPAPKGKTPVLPPQQQDRGGGFGIGGAIQLGYGVDQIGSLLKGAPAIGHPVNFGQFGELGAGVNTFNAAGTGALGGAGAGTYEAGSVAAAQSGEAAAAGAEVGTAAGEVGGAAAAESASYSWLGPAAMAVAGLDIIGGQLGWWDGPFFGLMG